ncbi:hypothetical protein Hanom_Chr01g00032071 [Helianthus anomalus]
MHYFKSKFENYQQHALCKSAQSSQIATIGTLLINTLLVSTLLISTISANNKQFVNQHNLRQ